MQTLLNIQVNQEVFRKQHQEKQLIGYDRLRTKFEDFLCHKGQIKSFCSFINSSKKPHF